MTCKAEGCDRTDLYRRGECSLHYRRMQKYGTYDESALQKPGPKPDPRAPRSRHNPDNPSRSRPAKGREEKTHCPQGHEYSEENTYRTAEGARHCKTCRRDRQREARGGLKGGYGSHNRNKTVCHRGHPFDQDNTIIKSNGARQCRACQRIWSVEKYGISYEHYEAMLTHQVDACAICRTPFEGTKDLHIDHCHTSGEVRGLLCKYCNTLLGFARDDTDVLRAAIEYLETR